MICTDSPAKNNHADWTSTFTVTKRLYQSDERCIVFSTLIFLTNKNFGSMELSPYILGALKGVDKERYVHKCQKEEVLIRIILRYTSFKDAASLHRDELPNLDYGNIYSYLINFKPYANQTLQAYKSRSLQVFYIWIGEGHSHQSSLMASCSYTGESINIICARVSLMFSNNY